MSPKHGSNGYYIDIPDVYANNLGAACVVTVSKGDEKIFTLRCSALSYAYTAFDSGNEDLINVAKAICLYNRAAVAFFDAEG